MKTRFLALALAAVSLTGCLEQNQKFILNPDGSGKLVVETTLDTSMTAALGGGAAGADMGKQIAMQLLRGTEGVEVWADLTHTTDGPKTTIKGTAYFPDINKVKMSGGENARGVSAGTLVSTKEGDAWTIATSLGEAPQPPAATPKPSAADISTSIQQAKTQWEAGKALIAPMLESAKVTTTVQVGGTIKETVGFAKEGDDTGTLSFTGKNIVSLLDEVMSDTKALEDLISSSGGASALSDPRHMQKLLMESLTGGKGLPLVKATPGKPVFDYKAEAAKAKAGQSAELKALQAEAAKPQGAVIRPPKAQ